MPELDDIYIKAFECFHKITETNPQNSDAWYKKGVVICGYIKNVPFNKKIFNALVYQDKLWTIKDIFRKSQDLDPSNSYDLAYEKYIFPAAVAYINDEISNLYDTAAPYYTLMNVANYCEEIGDNESATKYRERAHDFEKMYHKDYPNRASGF